MHKIILLLVSGLILFSCLNETKEVKSIEKPSVVKQSIPELTAASIYEDFQGKGFTVDKQIQDGDGFWTCHRSFENSDYDVRIYGTSPNNIIEIRGAYANNGKGNTNALAAEFLGYLATIPYLNSIPNESQKWVSENISKNAKKDFGDVTFELFANSKRIRTLLITPSKTKLSN